MTNVFLSLFVEHGTVVLDHGSAVIVDEQITADSLVIAHNVSASGSPGALSIALTPGSGFTINSTSGTDTSKIYFQVVSY